VKAYVAKARLLKLADLLCTLHRKRFFFGDWGTVPDGVCEGTDLLTSCGTRACALGWAPALPFAKRAGFALVAAAAAGPAPRTEADFQKNGLPILPEEAAAELFGLSEEEYLELFMPAWGWCSPERDATPKAVAKHIRAFVSRKYGASAKRSG